ncbi:MAG: polynucleotide adenylyltransferase/metal dependent phosphohydrolase [Frankiales bacterium]|nr:polynucleotide adenylyltransferase/metal dependent phosphohydrolase [Frankiales bacterium]
MRELVTRSPLLVDLGERFAAAGHQLHLVGGSVRDALLGRLGDDLDLTTDAHPEQVLALVEGWAEATWDVGIAFGTVGLQKRGTRVEITTYRSEAYDRTSRKPEVAYGESLEDDLVRRDFAMNALALALPDWKAPGAFVDLFGGMDDLAAGIIRTPGRPEDSFDDDPLRMLRAARFASQLGFTVAPEVVVAMTERAERISIVSAERIRAELEKLLLGAHPRTGLTLLVETGLAAYVLPELPALQLEIDEHHQHKDVYEHTLQVLERAIALEDGEPDLVLRLAALLHDIGKPATRRHEPGGGVSFHHHEVKGAHLARKRLKALTFGKDVVEAVFLLTEMHLRFHGYGQPGTSPWTDAAVRRYVHDAGDQLERLHKLTRSDCTTRNRRRAERLSAAYDDLEERIAALAEQEELRAIRPDLDGGEIMELLGLEPGPLVGQAYRHLLAVRMERGPLPHDEAVAELRAWHRTQLA